MKTYQTKEWLALTLLSKTPKQIAKEQHVSYKLINLYAIKFGLMQRTPETKLP